MSNWVEVTDIKLYAYHGCMPEERIIGSEYRVDIKVKSNFKKAAKSDNLKDAVDYVRLYKIVEEEMLIPADLLENVAYRIFDKIKKEFPELKKIMVKVAKLNPPIDGNVEKVCVVIKEKVR